MTTLGVPVATYETLDVRVEGKVALVLLDRPPVNAVNKLMQRELTRAFDEISERRDVNSVVLGATGDRAFCAGIDLKETAAQVAAGTSANTGSVRSLLDSGREWREAQAAIRHCAVPTIAAVEGAAIGAGFGLVGVCDIVVASTRASFGLTEINVGLLGGASKAIRMVGPARARKMLFTGVLETAEEFHRLGGIDELVEPGAALPRSLEIGQLLGGKSPVALRLAKESILRIEGDEMESRYRTEQDYTTRLMTFNDSREAMTAHAEKRDAVWTWS